MVDKYLQNRKCKFESFTRNEIYELFKLKNYNYPDKRADDLFLRSNTDNDAVVSCDEFV